MILFSPVSPEGTVSISPNYTVANVSDNVTFTCSAQGGPNNIFQWQHNDLALDFTTASIMIANIAISDGGNYTCTVSNAAGSDNEIAVLNILPRITTPPVNIETTNGSLDEFFCEAEGFPALNVTFERGNASNSNTTIDLSSTVERDDVNNTVTATLAFSPVTFGDEGSYRCIASPLFPVEDSLDLVVSDTESAILTS